MLAGTKAILKAAANDLYTVIMVSIVIYALSFMCQSWERGLMRCLVLVIFVDGLMRIVSFLLGA